MAISQTPFVFSCLMNISTSSIFDPRIAIIQPSPTGTAACIAFPLSKSKNSASLNSKDFEQTNALYSPNE